MYIPPASPLSAYSKPREKTSGGTILNRRHSRDSTASVAHYYSAVYTFTLSATNHSFEVEIASNLPEVIANRFKLEQVLRNLLENAVKYSAPGKRVTIAAHQQPERQRVVVGVSDQGIGIALEDQERIFSPNEQITRAETKNIWGVGLGLFIVNELVELTLPRS